jgi:hypothetical protein
MAWIKAVLSGLDTYFGRHLIFLPLQGKPLLYNVHDLGQGIRSVFDLFLGDEITSIQITPLSLVFYEIDEYAISYQVLVLSVEYPRHS